MEQTTFLWCAFCIIKMPEGQPIHWNLFSVGGGKPKIAASDCHRIGGDFSVQLCSEPVCLSFNWLLHRCQPIRCIITAKHNVSPTPSRNIGSKLCMYRAQCAAALNSSSKCIPFLYYHNATVAEFKARIVQLQIWTETTPTPPFRYMKRRRRVKKGEETVIFRAVLFNYWGTSVIKHPFTSEGYYFLPIPS